MKVEKITKLHLYYKTAEIFLEHIYLYSIQEFEFVLIFRVLFWLAQR